MHISEFVSLVQEYLDKDPYLRVSTNVVSYHQRSVVLVYSRKK